MCISTSGTPRAATSGPISGSYCQRADVVDDGHALVEREVRHRRLRRVDRQRHAGAAADRAQHRPQARQLLGHAHRRRTRARGLGADVDEVGAGVLHLAHEVEGANRIARQTVGRERIVGEVEDAHHQGASAKLERRTAWERDAEARARADQTIYSCASGLGSGDGTSGVRSFSRERSRRPSTGGSGALGVGLVEGLPVGQPPHLIGVQHLARQQGVGDVGQPLLVLGEDVGRAIVVIR